MESTAKGSAHLLTNRAVTQSQHRALARAFLRLALAVRALCALSASVIFCCGHVPTVALAIARASRSISVRKKDRLPVARGARVHPPLQPGPSLEQLVSARSR